MVRVGVIWSWLDVCQCQKCPVGGSDSLRISTINCRLLELCTLCTYSGCIIPHFWLLPNGQLNTARWKEQKHKRHDTIVLVHLLVNPLNSATTLKKINDCTTRSSKTSNFHFKKSTNLLKISISIHIYI